MVRFHKKIAAMGLAVSLSTMSNVFALGLGEVTWKSSLNQPLQAEIALYDLRGISNRELVVKLASPEDFAKAGLERPHALTNLVFTPIISNGKGVIKITSKDPIKEPYLDFLINVSWASGETLREYTLLIDPPAYEPAAVISKSSQVAKPAPLPVKQQAVTMAKNDVNKDKVEASQKKTKPKLTTAPTESGTIRARKGSSLWRVAERSKGKASIHQAMLAIYEANPDAFINGKMSLLKEGAVLRIPDTNKMSQQTRAEALSQVLANVNGSAPVVAKQRQVTAGKSSQLATSGNTSQDQLKLTGVSDTKDNAGNAANSSQKTIIADLTNKVAQAEEDLDATKRKNNELRDRMTDLESRLADMKKLIVFKDNQLASLQKTIAKQQLDAKDVKANQDANINQ